MLIDFLTATRKERYKVIAGAIVPRPIAWVTTVGSGGTVNLAPFSFFAPMAPTPAILGISISDHPQGGQKDTHRNIRATGEFVVHIPSRKHANAVHQSSLEYHESVSEVEKTSLELTESHAIATPRLVGVPLAIECRFFATLELPGGRHWVMGEMLTAHIDDRIVDDQTYLDYAAMQPLGRLIGDAYQSNDGVVRVKPEPIPPGELRPDES